ncbi:chemotaxis response regulator protein-glutamate methylesterase [Serpentinicella sp. ANB-PHB4]|uniref:protein-glutamate methylesterase/protein-glutamine glutaminase n=1 Tax=Serpentinicella sp. ANB-PHB4 TaxID=3074076 RepID=UPI002861FCF1|nr:chemotaxis response regulator protein-glutamate methylesterase [Serpentinicella sp. ANB-PHB4]MDR5658488.1 chemotaxis response regulator protein-glutamate methylesterase [Serpentinicella sp. ANB-PHB4]
MRKIRVLIVEDSLLFREFLKNALEQDTHIEVLGLASNPFEARDKIIKFRPDVMTLDIEMPRMDGIEFLKKLMPQYPLPTVVISSASEKVFEALNSGAVDFIDKPSGKNADVFMQELIFKIKMASTVNLDLLKTEKNNLKRSTTKISLIAIGASTGGTEAISYIIKNLPKTVPGIVVVQHMPKTFTKIFANRLNEISVLDVLEAENGTLIKPGQVLIAPGDYHLKVKKTREVLKVELNQNEKINGHRPSVDVFFDSIVGIGHKESLGIILTGMGKDGSKGLYSLLKLGAKTIGQDEKSSVIYGMPKAAYDLGAVERQVPLEKIPNVILQMLN